MSEKPAEDGPYPCDDDLFFWYEMIRQRHANLTMSAQERLEGLAGQEQIDTGSSSIADEGGFFEQAMETNQAERHFFQSHEPSPAEEAMNQRLDREFIEKNNPPHLDIAPFSLEPINAIGGPTISSSLSMSWNSAVSDWLGPFKMFKPGKEDDKEVVRICSQSSSSHHC